MKKWFKRILFLVFIGTILHGLFYIINIEYITRHILVTVLIFSIQFTDFYETIQ